MMKITLKKLLYILALTSIVLLVIVSGFKDNTLENEGFFLSNYSEFDNYNKINNTPLVYEVSLGTDKVGYLVFESEYGYQSDVTIATLIGMDQTILNVKTYTQNETPAFYNRIENANFFKNNFAGKEILNEFRVGSNVDGVSTATISSVAITKAIQKGVSFVSSKYFDVHIKLAPENFIFGQVEIALVILFLIVIVAYKMKNKKLRYLALIYSVVILGFKFNQFISYSWLASIVTFNIPNIAKNLRWYILVGGAIGLIAVTGKNLYCAYICPFGAFQEMEYRLAKFDFFKVNPKLKKLFSLLPGIIAYFALVMALTSEQLGATSYEPFSLLFGRSGIDIQWVLLPLVIIFSLFVMRFYCNYGCPVGFVLGLVVKARQRVVKLWTKIISKRKES